MSGRGLRWDTTFIKSIFWKQFFEASANVSLSGYEEQPNEDTVQDQTVTEESTNTTHTTLDDAASYETPSSEHLDIDHRGEDLDLSSLTISPSHSTPRPPVRQSGQDEPTTLSIPYPSPYETLREEGTGNEDTSALPGDTPVTPGRSAGRQRQDQSETPLSSPFIPPESTARKSRNNNNNQKPTDPVLHRVLDKTYRVQATPLTKGTGRTKFTVTPKDKPTSRYAFDDSPISSPEMEAPKLHEEIFSSPLKGQTPGTSRKRRPSKTRVTPKPGISVLTPAKTRKGSAWDSDDDLDDLDNEDFGTSPPKTMQFHIPHSRLMKTPAKEASKRIVSDILATAGGTDLTDEYGYGLEGRQREEEEHSPTVIQRSRDLADETF
ncbi:hypothetical protein T310_2664 [Rasamsonia emersonii CBS 393.64]|uniref:DASH complex subunit ASK1 n=1 Tax=Rasamsonia emersonii (strain ATCC 16479 / CBS 393.64 / IMI 116815) TaxID=1408163 RepID=A0A0F4YYZ3_RASE3|nr:hypothetical protein T310_2664 [Rasamsonia emersonii CBS 393.64]KKA23305.1 hypothetical protein T310_2664 [Rasamsonia emersonii CBS 393.64]